MQEPDLKKITGSMAGSAIGGSLGQPSGKITDDTQMALFTAEGLILSKVRAEYSSSIDTAEPVFHSLLRWLYTQQAFMLPEMINTYGSCSIVDGILMGHQELFALRDPCDTCLETLSRGRMGTLDAPVSDSPGPGALVRTLPVGLVIKDAEKAFETGCKTAAITHGHRDAVLSSGFFASLISRLAAGQPLPWALNTSLKILETKPGHTALAASIESAVSQASTSKSPGPEVIEQNFSDRTAASTLCAGIFSGLCHPKNVEKGLLVSVGHSGNTDETGAVAGAVLGAANGIDTIPVQLLDALELKAVILEISTDLFNLDIS